MSSVLIILGYGVFAESNLNYKSYLDRTVTVIKAKQIDKIVICGGFTNKNSEISEAASIRNYLVKQDQLLGGKIILEEKSITTPQNLEFASKLLTETSPLPKHLTVVCDSIRAPKVYYLALRYLSSLLRLDIPEEQIYLTLLSQSIEKRLDITQDVELTYQNITIKGFNLDRKPKEIGEQIIATMEEIGAYNYSSVDEDILNFKRKQFEI